jgi:transposase-like protein
MEGPNTKELNPGLSPLFVGTIHDKLREYDGRRVGAPRPCPGCDSTDHRKNGYQRAPKTFARLVTETGFEEVGLEVQQYECTACGRSYQGDLSEYFYDGCGYAKPIVDLAVFHAADNSYQATERLLARLYGLQVDSGTIQRYDERFDRSAETDEWFTVQGHRISLPFLAFLFDEDLEEGSPFVISSQKALW